MSGADLAGMELFYDLNGDKVKQDNEPWLDIFCVYCTGTTQAQLKTSAAPVGIGLQGTSANSYKIGRAHV